MSWRDEEIGKGVSRCPSGEDGQWRLENGRPTFGGSLGRLGDDPAQRSSVPDADRRMSISVCVRIDVRDRDVLDAILRRW